MRSTTPNSPRVLVCNPAAIAAASRPRYQELRNRLMSAVRERRDLPDGYALLIDSAALMLPEAAEWIDMERRCCPFLTIQLEAPGGGEDFWLRLRGPAGTKAILAAELGI